MFSSPLADLPCASLCSIISIHHVIRGTIQVNHTTGNADHDSIVRNVFGHDRVRNDRHIIADAYRSDNYGTWANVHIVAYD